MNRRAAGGAGRPPVAARARCAVLAAFVAGATLLPGLPASAAPARPSSTPASSAPTGSSVAERPVDVTVTRLEPRTVTPSATVQMSVSLVNDGDDTLTDLSLRLQRGDRLTTRQALTEDLATPSTGGAAQAAFAPVPGELEPGDSIAFTYTATAADLQLTEAGVYPVLVNVNGTRAGLVERVGELSTHLVVQPDVLQPGQPTSRTTVAWLWPLTDRPHRDAQGAFTDDDLAAEVSADGRLDRMLDVVEQLPDGGTTVPVSLAVDPALVEELAAMRGGYTVDGETGAGSAAAADWLDRLRALAAVHPVIALPYADVDADALQAAGLAGALTRSLPGTPEGTAVQPTDAGGDPAATPTVAPDPEPVEPATTGAGAQLLADELGVTPRTDLAWPAEGAVRADTLATLQAGGVDQLVLSADGYTDAAAALGGTGETAAARVPVDTASGETTTLVADPALSEVVATAETTAGGPRVAEQRYLAELGVLTDQLATVDPAVAQTVLVVPPRDLEADPDWATAMMADTVTQPWLAAASVEQLAEGPVAAAGDLVDPAAADQLSGPPLADLAAAVGIREDVAAAVVGDADTALAGYDAAVSRASSSAWRGEPDGFAAAAADVLDTLTGLRGQVSLLSPADGAYSLASSDAPLVLTVRNDLPFAVTVRVALTSRGNVGFSSGEVPAATVEPQSRTTVTVPTQVRQSGSFQVVAMLTTPTGGPLGESVQMRVTSTAYGPITLAITIGAAALLGLLFLRRLVLFVLRRRRGEPRPVDDDVLVPVDGPGPAENGPPPTRRSPV
ncbi:hypothetical protein ASG36_09510 [Geodermatophilus sp. Leaf369]|uniref:DUF6049 family protein n=1 Tax=Geodermatophilus sp. Leaf369 TaxID=1736354 RepID=UPI0006F23F42|nr:DUF6049 family protein [Geodermatophilus sp. Leaf369]KQS58321.1 hypothetical protein ASG36_09510 [Geodermatophilus sp. Leaf369]